jgi:RNA polymerase-associated protein LEO1
MSDAHASDDDVAHQPAAPASEQGDTPRDTVEDVGLGDDDNDDDDDLFGDGGDMDDEPAA